MAIDLSKRELLAPALPTAEVPPIKYYSPPPQTKVNVLERLFPDLIQPGLDAGLSPNEIPDASWQAISSYANEDWNGFINDISQRETTDGDIRLLFRGLGVPLQEAEKYVKAFSDVRMEKVKAKSADEIFSAVFPGQTTDMVLQEATDNFDGFIGAVQQKGRTPATEALLQYLGYTPDDYQGLWPTKGIHLDFTQVAAEQAPRPGTFEALPAEIERKRIAAKVQPALEILGRGLGMLPQQVVSTALQATQGKGGATITGKDWADKYIEQSNRDMENFIKEAITIDKKNGVKLGYALADLAQLPQNMAYSITSMGAGIAAGAPVAFIPLPGARVTAYALGTVASGAVAYNMTTYQIMQTYLEYKNEEKLAASGIGITAEEEQRLKQDFDSKAMQYGLWEAVPEAISNLNFVTILGGGGLLAKVAGKNIATKIIAKLVALYGGELLTETITQKGQSDIEVEAGLREGKINLFEAFKEIAPQTFLLTTVMAGSGQVIISSTKGISKITNSLKSEIGESHPLFKTIKDKLVSGGEFIARAPLAPLMGTIYRPQGDMQSDYENAVIKSKALEDELATNKAAGFTWLIPKLGAAKGEIQSITIAQFQRLTGEKPNVSILTKDGKRVMWEYALDGAATEQGYKSGDEFRDAIMQAQDDKKRLIQLKREVIGLDNEIRASRNDPRAGLYDDIAEAQKDFEQADKVLEFDPTNEDAIYVRDIAQISISDLQEHPSPLPGTPAITPKAELPLTLQNQFPTGKSKATQISMEDQLRLEKARKAQPPAAAQAQAVEKPAVQPPAITPEVPAVKPQAPTAGIEAKTGEVQPAAEVPPVIPPKPPVTEAAPPAPFSDDMPASKQVFARISIDPDKVSLSDKLSKGWDTFQTKMIDDLHPIDKFVNAANKGGLKVSMEENPYILARMLRGVASKASSFIESGTFGRKYWQTVKGKTKIAFNGESLKAILAEVSQPTEWRDFSTYLTAVHSSELSGYNIETGIDKVIADQSVRELEAKYPGFKKLAARVYDYQNRVLDYVRESGCASAELLEILRQKYLAYVPFNRAMEAMEQKGYMGSKMADIASPIKRIKGSERLIVNPLENIVKNTYALISAADRNMVGVAMARMAEQMPELQTMFEHIKTPIAPVAQVTLKELGIDLPGLTEEQSNQVINIFRPSMFNADNTVTVLIDGKRQFYKLEPELYRGMLNLDIETLGTVMRFISYPAKWLRAGAVLSPDFAIRNPTRDQHTAYIFSKYGFVPGVDWVRGIASIIGKDEDYQLFRASGVESSVLVGLDRDVLSKTFKEIVEGKHFTDYIKHPLELLQIASSLGEEATRLGEFKRAISHGVSGIEAGYAGKDVTVDFSKAGTSARAINQIIAFFNANIRGIDQTITGFKERPIQTSMKVLLSITIPSILLYFVNRDDPRWKEIPQWQKDLFWIFFVGDTIVRYPKPFIMGQLFGTVPERYLEWLDTKDPDLFNDTWESIVESNMPGWLPNAAIPFIENIANHSFFLNRPIVSVGKEALPPELQYTEYTSEVAKGLGAFLKYSPMKIDNFIAGWTGGLGRYATAAIDLVLKGTGIVPSKIEPSPTLADIPGLKAFIIRNPYGSSSEAMNDFYNMLESFSQKEQALKKYFVDNNEKAFEELKAANPELLFAYDYGTKTWYSASARYLRTVSGELADIRKLEDKVYSSNMSAEQKRIVIDNLDRIMTELSRKAVDLLKYPGRMDAILDTPIEEIADKLGTENPDVPVLSPDNPNYGMGDIKGSVGQVADQNKDNPLVRAWLKNEEVWKIVSTMPDVALYKITSPIDMAGLTRRDKELLNEYVSTADKDKPRFLAEHDQLKINRKQEWLKNNPEDNAVLALWGNADLLTTRAYKIVQKMITDLDIPDSVTKEFMPSPDIADDYFSFLDAANPKEAELIKNKNLKLLEFLDHKPSDIPIPALELQAEHYDNIKLLENYGKESSVDYIADEKARQGAVDALRRTKVDGVEFRDIERRIDAINAGTEESPISEDVILNHIAYMRLVDEPGIGSSSAEVMLIRVDNPDYDDFRTDKDIWGDKALKPVDMAKVPIWRIDVKYRKEDADYQAILDKYGPGEIKEQTAATKAYLDSNADYATARIQRDGYNEGYEGDILDKYVAHYQMPIIGSYRERDFIANPDLYEAMSATAISKGEKPPLKYSLYGSGELNEVKPLEYDELKAEYKMLFDRVEAVSGTDDKAKAARLAIRNKDKNFNKAYLTVEAYDKKIPAPYIDNYVEYNLQPDKDYMGRKSWAKERYFAARLDFYAAYREAQEHTSFIDFDKIPSEEVEGLYYSWDWQFGAKAKLDYRLAHPTLDDWLVRTKRVPRPASEEGLARPLSGTGKALSDRADYIDKLLQSLAR